MNIYRMTMKKIQQAIKKPLPKECQYGSIEELLIWSFDVLDARSRCELRGKQKTVYNALVTGKLEFYFDESRDFALPILTNPCIRGNRHGNQSKR